MNWNDLLRMSINSLRRRKLRTFLTVLGVLIGTASIVVMISLGLGMQQSLYKEVEQSGGLTSITVTGSDNSDGMTTESMGSGQETEKRIDDQLVEKISKMDHVKLAAPIYETSGLLYGVCPVARNDTGRPEIPKYGSWRWNASKDRNRTSGADIRKWRDH